jgi:hypothetical protein
MFTIFYIQFIGFYYNFGELNKFLFSNSRIHYSFYLYFFYFLIKKTKCQEEIKDKLIDKEPEKEMGTKLNKRKKIIKLILFTLNSSNFLFILDMLKS